MITNVRAVWFAQLTENFNASVPFMQIMTVSKKLSKFGMRPAPKIQTIFGIHFMAPIGTALVMETTQRSGSFTLGFRIDPPDKLDLVLKVRLFCPPASPTSLIAIQFHYVLNCSPLTRPLPSRAGAYSPHHNRAPPTEFRY